MLSESATQTVFKRLHVPHKPSGITGTNKVSPQIHRSEQKTATEGNCGHRWNEPVQAVTIHTAQNCQDFVHNNDPKSAVGKDLKSRDKKMTQTDERQQGRSRNSDLTYTEGEYAD